MTQEKSAIAADIFARMIAGIDEVPVDLDAIDKMYSNAAKWSLRAADVFVAERDRKAQEEAAAH